MADRITPEEHADLRHGLMPTPRWVQMLTAVAVLNACFWIAAHVWLAWPTLQSAMSAAGELNRCGAVSAAECIAMAQEVRP